MESMAAALSKAASEVASAPCGELSTMETTKSLQIRLLSPSASIGDNERVKDHIYVRPANPAHFKVDLDYTSLARSVSMQMDSVLSYLQSRVSADRSVVVLSEESSFGSGAARDLDNRRLGPQNSICKIGATGRQEGCWGRLVNVQFPPNIAAIRAEHVKIQQYEDAQRRQIVPERLLELDLTGVDKGADQPPTYQPSLSSRSDELMLYQTFDALKKSIHPAAVIIVATDVRDRLFLLSQIRDLLPGALPIVLEQDNLLEHPDYRDISRGSITMPAGKSLVCLNTYNDPVPCPSSALAASSSVALGDSPECPSYPRRFAFATDYAANTFRAMVRLAKPQDALNGTKIGTFLSPDQEWMAPHMLVATLAGFQEVEDARLTSASVNSPMGDDQATCSAHPAEKQDTLIVADARIQLQGPVYLSMTLVFLMMLVVALWLIRNGGERSLLVFPVHRYALHWSTVVGIEPSKSFGKVGLGSLLVWIIMALAGLAIAGRKVVTALWPYSDLDADLAHGRALWVLIGLCLAYGCFIVLTMLRVREWDAHCAVLSDAVGRETPLGMRLRRHGVRYAVPGTLILLAVLCLCANDLNPVSVDCVWASALAATFMLCGSAFFLALFAEAFDRLCRISIELDKVVVLVRRESGANDWPTPWLLGERPASPFNIAMHLKNYLVWHQSGYADWAKDTQSLLAGKWTLGPSTGPQFEAWQALLVAEMKFAITAMRTCAWCCVLGATLAMLLIQVYPPVYPRLQATASAMLLAFGFAAIVYVVLKLERDSLLGRMFTSDKDNLTFGSALSVLWPKLLGLASILVTAFLPSVWGWVGGLVKAINSLH